MSDVNVPKVDHLLLLIGANPVPNAVAASLLATKDSYVSLIHSRHTSSTAQHLQQWLTGRGRTRVRLRQVAESRPNSIVQEVKAELDAVGARSVGLHYTGGTKAMAVHAYRTVERWGNRSPVPSLWFTYLDARKLELVIDPSDAWSGQVERTEHVGEAVELGLQDLLDLHGWKLKHPDKIHRPPVLPRTAQALANAVGDKAVWDAWRAWVDEELKAKCRRDNRPDKWESNTTLAAIRLPLPDHSGLADVRCAVAAELNQPTDEIDIGAAAKASEQKEGEFCTWLDGKWLESAVLQALREIQADCSLHDVSSNLEPQAGGDNPTHFQFDVVAIRGYQLFAISCTTDDRHGTAKQKLFEAFIRAQQMGGDEARVALVCCYDDPVGLEHEVQRDIDAEGRIRVFGRGQLGDLTTHLREWTRTASRLE